MYPIKTFEWPNQVTSRLWQANETKYSRIDQLRFVEYSLLAGRNHFKCFIKRCIPQFLLGPFLNILSQMNVVS